MLIPTYSHLATSIHYLVKVCATFRDQLLRLEWYRHFMQVDGPLSYCFRHIPILFVTLTNSEKDLPFICGKDSTFTCHIQPKVDWLCIARCYNYDQWADNFGATLALSLSDVCRSLFKLENNELAARKNWCFDWHTLPIFRKKEKKAYRLKREM